MYVSQDTLLPFHQEGDSLSWEIVSDHELQDTKEKMTKKKITKIIQ